MLIPLASTTIITSYLINKISRKINEQELKKDKIKKKVLLINDIFKLKKKDGYKIFKFYSLSPFYYQQIFFIKSQIFYSDYYDYDDNFENLRNEHIYGLPTFSSADKSTIVIPSSYCKLIINNDFKFHKSKIRGDKILNYLEKNISKNNLKNFENINSTKYYKLITYNFTNIPMYLCAKKTKKNKIIYKYYGPNLDGIIEELYNKNEEYLFASLFINLSLLIGQIFFSCYKLLSL
jgi:hypothetical protein